MKSEKQRMRRKAKAKMEKIMAWAKDRATKRPKLPPPYPPASTAPKVEPAPEVKPDIGL